MIWFESLCTTRQMRGFVSRRVYLVFLRREIVQDNCLRTSFLFIYFFNLRTLQVLMLRSIPKLTALALTRNRIILTCSY